MFLLLVIAQILLDALLITGLVANQYWKPLAMLLIRVGLTAFYLLRGRDKTSEGLLSSAPFSRAARTAILAVGMLSDCTLILFDIQLGKLHP